MTAAYFEDHPTDPDKMIMRKPKHDFGEPWSPVSIGVDVTSAGAHVVGIYALDADTSQIFYAKHHPAPQRTWVGLTDEDEIDWEEGGNLRDLVKAIEAKLKEKNT
jgi:hypothetical protein